MIDKCPVCWKELVFTETTGYFGICALDCQTDNALHFCIRSSGNITRINFSLMESASTTRPAQIN
jgi:hypothetical protein